MKLYFFPLFVYKRSMQIFFYQSTGKTQKKCSRNVEGISTIHKNWVQVQSASSRVFTFIVGIQFWHICFSGTFPFLPYSHTLLIFLSLLLLSLSPSLSLSFSLPSLPPQPLFLYLFSYRFLGKLTRDAR